MDQETETAGADMWQNDPAAIMSMPSSDGPAAEQAAASGPSMAQDSDMMSSLFNQYADGDTSSVKDQAAAPKQETEEERVKRIDKPLEDSWGNSLIGGLGGRLVAGGTFLTRLIAGQISKRLGKGI